MRLHERKRHSFGLNTATTSDISFMLLVFFLVTTSMYVDKGLLRQLPPKEKEEAEERELLVEKENVMSLSLDAEGGISVNDTLTSDDLLVSRMTAFILNRQSKHIFTIDAAGDCPYEAYYNVQNALSEAYREARDAEAEKQYGCKMDHLDNGKREAILARLPHRVAENYHFDK